MMNHKRYPLAYLLEVVMPLNLVITRDEEPGEDSKSANQAKSDWVIGFDAGNGKTATVNYFHHQKRPFEFQCRGFDEHQYYRCNEQRMIAAKSANLWDAIQILRTLDAHANAKVTQLV